MERRQKQVIEAYRRVQVFVRAHPVPAPATYGGAGQLLDDVLELVAVEAMRQAAGRRQASAETRRQRQLVRGLRQRHLRPIAKVAAAVLQGAPGIEVALRIPGIKSPVERLVAEAMAIRTAVSPYAPVLVIHGRPGDFLEQLDAVIDAVRTTLRLRAELVGARIRARHALAELLRRGRGALEMIDAIVVANFGDERDVIAAWHAARRVHAATVPPPMAADVLPAQAA